MTWPGAPKSQQSPPINEPSTRYPSKLSEKSTIGEVAEAVRTAFDGLTVHEQAFANLPSQIASQAKAAATEAVTEFVQNETTTGVTSFNTNTGAIVYFPNLGMVNNQLGNTSYTTQQSDDGLKILMGDSTPASVTLNPAVQLPWFTFIGNDSTSSVTLSSSAPIYGVRNIPQGSYVLVFCDGIQFWSEGITYATDSSFGIVEPDGVTTVIDSSTGLLRTNGITVNIVTAQLTSLGSQGSMTFVRGILVAQTPAT